RSSWNGPALTTVTYVESRGVSGNVHTRPPSARSSTEAGAVLLVTVQDSGACTVNACGALRSGWSKQAQARRASSGSNDVHTYNSLSEGSTERCTHSPVLVSGCTDSTTSTFSAWRSARAIRPFAIAVAAIAVPFSVADTPSTTASTN